MLLAFCVCVLPNSTLAHTNVNSVACEGRERGERRKERLLHGQINLHTLVARKKELRPHPLHPCDWIEWMQLLYYIFIDSILSSHLLILNGMCFV